MQFFTLAIAAIAAVSAQSSIAPSLTGTVVPAPSMGSVSVAPVRPSSMASAGSMVSSMAPTNMTQTINSTTTTTIYATRTVTISGVVTTVVVSTATKLAPAATTMIVVPGTVTVNGQPNVVTVVIPVVGGSVINTGVASMTLAPGRTAANATATTALPIVSTLPTAGSDATKLYAGAFAAIAAAVVLAL